MSSGKKWINPQAAGLWKMYAEAFLNPKGNILYVNYNTFLVDIEYRKKLSKDLGGVFCDESLNFVDDNGQGSSFDGVDYNGNAKEMPVFDRWKEYKDIEAFKELFTEEVIEQSKLIFGEQEWKMLYS